MVHCSTANFSRALTRALLILWWQLGGDLMVHGRDQRGMRDALRDVDFSPAHRNRILAATAEDGTGALWHWERGQPVASLELPPGLPQQSFTYVSLKVTDCIHVNLPILQIIFHVREWNFGTDIHDCHGGAHEALHDSRVDHDHALTFRGLCGVLSDPLGL